MKKYKFLILGLILFFTGFAYNAFANTTLYSDVSATVYGSGANTNNFQVTTEGTVGLVKLYMYTTSPSTTGQLHIYNADTLTQLDCNSASDTIGNLGATTAGFSDPLGNSYLPAENTFSGTECELSTGINYRISMNPAGPQTAFYNPYLILESTEPTYSITPSSPAGTITSPINFSGSYVSDETHDIIVIFLQEIGQTDTLPITIEIPEKSGSYAYSLPLAEGEYRSFASLVRRRDFDVLVTSEWVNFTIDNDYGGGVGGVGELGEILECDGLTDIGCHLQNVWTRIQNVFTNSISKVGEIAKTAYNAITLKNFFPFSILNALQNVINQPMPEGNTNLSLSVTVFGASVPLLDTSTTQTWLGSSANTIKTVLGYIFWIAFFWSVYETIQKIVWKITTQHH